MKKFYRISKIGNSIFATLSKDVVDEMNISSGDQVSYEIIPGTNKIVLNLSGQKQNNSKKNDKQNSNWISKLAGSITI